MILMDFGLILVIWLNYSEQSGANLGYARLGLHGVGSARLGEACLDQAWLGFEQPE